jgi:hypothetical protein
VSQVFRSVDSDRQKWEDRVNAAFAKIKSLERVCFHADCTVTVNDKTITLECDYCPAWLMSPDTVRRPKVLVPVYFRDGDPLYI